MFRNYLKVALRHLLKYKVYSGINIVGLAVGICCCVLIVLYIQFELGYDRHHAQFDRIFRVVSERQVGGSVEEMANVPFPTGPALAANFPEIVESARLLRATNGASIKYADKLFTEDLFFFADPAVFEVFTFDLVSGDPASALVAPNSAVITERMAEKYFGTEQPIGKTISVTLLGKTGDLVVTGIIKNPPVNAHFDLDFLVPFASVLNGWNQGPIRWDSGILGAWTYLLLTDKKEAASLAQKFPVFVQTHLPPSMQGSLTFSLQPLTRIHLHSHRVGELGANGNIVYIYILAGIALLVLLLACANFVNLSTALSIQRAKEVGIRKTFGAGQKQLIGQYLGEAFLISFVAITLAVGLVKLALPLLQSIMGKPLSLDIANDSYIFATLIGMWVMTSLLAGLYPAFVLSSFRPIKVLKGRSDGSVGKKLSLRKVMIVSQFSVAIILLITFWTILDQLDYIKHKELGFKQEQLLVITGQSGVSFEAMKHELKKSPDILNMTVTSRVPGGRHLASSLITPEGSDAETRLQIPFLKVEYEFLRTFGLKLTDGRDFSPSDQHAVILNEAAVQAFGWQSGALGKELVQFSRGTEQAWHVIGVVKDVHFESLHTEVEPLILAGGISFGSRIIVRVSPDDIAGTVAHIRQTWATFSPESPLDFYFLDEDLTQLYLQEERLSKVIQWFTVLAILISCIGLFGLIAFSTGQRAKEMGIRKVLGATVADIVMLLSREFVVLVATALILAIPVAYLVVDQWLAVFAYRVEVSSLTFLFAGGLVLILALFIAASRSTKVALVNPVETLRSQQ